MTKEIEVDKLYINIDTQVVYRVIESGVAIKYTPVSYTSNSILVLSKEKFKEMFKLSQ